MTTATEKAPRTSWSVWISFAALALSVVGYFIKIETRLTVQEQSHISLQDMVSVQLSHAAVLSAQRFEQVSRDLQANQREQALHNQAMLVRLDMLQQQLQRPQ